MIGTKHTLFEAKMNGELRQYYAFKPEEEGGFMHFEVHNNVGNLLLLEGDSMVRLMLQLPYVRYHRGSTKVPCLVIGLLTKEPNAGIPQKHSEKPL
mmetsp:Transcript_2082/g.13444  ORF Transcript_2082/g.13444 Transcript_2082/m.13444 type:complete len:96 (+) Transcript_2082:745-1032(+)